MMDILREYEKAGGILIGSSAGSIVQTPSIEVAGFADRNVVPKFTDFDALNLVDFMVKPHFNGYVAYSKVFDEYAKSRKTMLYGLYEGDAIVRDDKEIVIYGNPSVFNGL